jgi:hypothetical protein
MPLKKPRQSSEYDEDYEVASDDDLLNDDVPSSFSQEDPPIVPPGQQFAPLYTVVKDVTKDAIAHNAALLKACNEISLDSIKSESIMEIIREINESVQADLTGGRRETIMATKGNIVKHESDDITCNTPCLGSLECDTNIKRYLEEGDKYIYEEIIKESMMTGFNAGGNGGWGRGIYSSRLLHSPSLIHTHHMQPANN